MLILLCMRNTPAFRIQLNLPLLPGPANRPGPVRLLPERAHPALFLFPAVLPGVPAQKKVLPDLLGSHPETAGKRKSRY